MPVAKATLKQGITLQLDADELKSRQSVRTTFRLPEKTINLLKVSAKHLGIKQKTLLDQLIEDESILNLLADEAQTHSRKNNSVRPKTFVLSRNALDLLEAVSDRHDVGRDFLVELSIARLSSYIDSLSEKHDKRRSLLGEIEEYQRFSRQILDKAKITFEQEDPFLIKLERLDKTMQRTIEEIRDMVKDKNEFIY